jgi:hypothetical protein
MSNTLYATFSNPEAAEKAAGALLDHGVRPEDLSVVRKHHDGFTPVTSPTATASDVLLTSGSPIEPGVTGSIYGTEPVVARREESDIEDVAKHGITTTTAGDAGAGAVKGSLVGAGIGAIAVLAALIVPGVGIVLGAGALASALGGVIASAGAGAAAGAIVGYLKDMGVDDQLATEYGETIEEGGAILAVSVPSGEVDEAEVSAVLNKYAATNVNRYESRTYVA